jgi:selenocysteine-specific elongation factor
MSRHLILGTAGHVDHGKTALIKALTGIDCDTHKEEKERGITINLGFAHMDLPSGERVGIVDVPGHKDFIRTMVAGAYGIDLVMLVIAADSGIMPQTTEHLNIIRMLGIRNGIIALTKTDLVDEETLDLAKLEIMEFVEGTPLENAPVVAVSSITGQGLDILVNEIDRIAKIIPEREKGPVFRMYIDRLFNIRGQGYVVTGTVMNGSVETGEDLYLLPGFDRKLKVRQIERHGKTVGKVCAGDRAALNLAGITAEDLERGLVLSDHKIPFTTLVDATIELFRGNRDLIIWSQVIFFTGTFKSMAKIHLLDNDRLPAGEPGLVQIHLEKQAILMNNDHYIIRNSSNDMTLGGGIILDVKPLHHKKRTGKLVEYLKEMREARSEMRDAMGIVKVEVRKETGPVLMDALAAKLHMSPEDLTRQMNDAVDQDIRLYTTAGKGILILEAMDESIRKKVLAALDQWHQANPLVDAGIDAKALAGKLGYQSPVQKLYLDALLVSMQQNGSIRPSGSTWMRDEFKVAIDLKMQEALSWIGTTIEGFGVQRSVATDMESLVSAAQSKGLSKQKLMMLLNYLVKQGTLYFHDDDYIHRSVVDKCRNLLLTDLMHKEAGINEKEFRLLIDSTKRLVQTLIGIFVSEGSIAKQTFYLRITEKGKKMLNPK